MKRVKNSVFAILFALGLVAAPSGCAARTVYVVRRPPVARVEVVPVRPYPRAVWISGHWRWKHGRYVWVGGYWKKARPGYVWVPGRWIKRPRGWVWRKGHWKKY